jgi:hypothetical protein
MYYGIKYLDFKVILPRRIRPIPVPQFLHQLFLIHERPFNELSLKRRSRIQQRSLRARRVSRRFSL